MEWSFYLTIQISPPTETSKPIFLLIFAVPGRATWGQQQEVLLQSAAALQGTIGGRQSPHRRSDPVGERQDGGTVLALQQGKLWPELCGKYKVRWLSPWFFSFSWQSSSGDTLVVPCCTNDLCQWVYYYSFLRATTFSAWLISCLTKCNKIKNGKRKSEHAL